MTTWTIDGVDLKTAGVRSLDFSFTNQAADTASLSLVDRGVALRQWARRQRVEIRRNGQPFFVGWVSEPSSSATGGDSGADVILEGPWMWLEKITFGRVLTTEEGGGIATTAQLFYQRGESLGIVGQIQEVLTWAQNASSRAFGVGLIAPGSVPDLPPPEWVQAASCADVFRRVAGWSPDCVLWADYAGGVPVLNWTQPGARQSHSFALGQRPLVSAQVVADSDLAPTAVIIQYNGEKNARSGTARPGAVDAFPPGASPQTPGASVFSLGASDYRGKPWAEALWQMGRRWQWGGEVRLENTLQIVRPGDVVRLAGRQEWLGSEAVVQTVQISAADDSVTLSMGAPGHLGLDDLRELLWWMKRSEAPQTEPELNLHSFQVYEEEDKLVVPLQKRIKIAPGFVNFGEVATMPTWNGQRLDSKRAFSEPLKRNLRRSYFLKITWKPEVSEFVGYDTLGRSVTSWRATSQGELMAAEIVTTTFPNKAPRVSIRSGAVTEGEFYFPIATVEEIAGEIRVVQHRTTDLAAFFAPPNFLYLLES